MFENLVRTPKKTQRISITKINFLLLLKTVKPRFVCYHSHTSTDSEWMWQLDIIRTSNEFNCAVNTPGKMARPLETC